MLHPAIFPVPSLILHKDAPVKTTISQSSTFLLKFGNEIMDVISSLSFTTFIALERSFIVPSFSLKLRSISKPCHVVTEVPFLDLHLTASGGLGSSKMYDKRDDFDFDIVNFPFLYGNNPRAIVPL